MRGQTDWCLQPRNNSGNVWEMWGRGVWERVKEQGLISKLFNTKPAEEGWFGLVYLPNTSSCISSSCPWAQPSFLTPSAKATFPCKSLDFFKWTCPRLEHRISELGFVWRQAVEGKDTNKTSLENVIDTPVTHNIGLDQGVTEEMVKSSQILDAFEGRSQRVTLLPCLQHHWPLRFGIPYLCGLYSF